MSEIPPGARATSRNTANARGWYEKSGVEGVVAMRVVTDMFAWANANVPDWNTISISGYHMREAGSTAVQEVAFTLSTKL